MPNILTVTVASTGVAIANNTWKLSDKIDQVSSLNFTIVDSTGANTYSKGQPVVASDSVYGTLFTGYLNKPKANNLYPNTTRKWACDCTDQTWLAAKRQSTSVYNQQQAAVILCDQLQHILAVENLTGQYALDYNHFETDWAAGGATLSNVVATTNNGDGNVGDGDLELALAGSIATHTDNSTANFTASGTSETNINTANNQLQLLPYATLGYSGTANSGYGANLYAYQKIWSGSYTIASGDALVYSVWINSSSPQIKAGIDGVCSDGTAFRNSALTDQNGIPSHPGTDLSGFANDQWYTRTIPIGSLAGKSLSFVDVGFEGDSQGQYQAYFHDIAIWNSGVLTQSIYVTPGSYGTPAPVFPQLNASVSDYGYGNVTLTPVVGYAQTGTWTSAANSAASAGVYQSSQIFWSIVDATTGIAGTNGSPPATTTITVSTSLDGGATYQPIAAQYDALVNALAGESLTGINVLVQVMVAITGKDPIYTPAVTSLSWFIYPSYNATITNVAAAYVASSDWSTGTFSQTEYSTSANLMENDTGLIVSSSQRSWFGGNVSGQTVFGTGTPTQQISIGQLQLVCTNSSTSDIRSRFDFAGQWADFVAQITVEVPNPNANVGLVYRTTGWQNLGGTYAYAAYVSQDSATQTSIQLWKGSNTSSGGGSASALGSFTLPEALTSGDNHILTIIAIGSQHSVYLDGTLYLNVTDSTYTAAGYLGARFFNNSGAREAVEFNNFGVIAKNGVYMPGTYSGPTWTSPSLSLGSMTVGNSIINWNDEAVSGDYVQVLASVNGGTAVACTNGAVIPGLTPGTVLTSATVQITVQLQASAPTDTPVINGLSLLVTPQFSATGHWTSPALSLAGIGGVAGSSVVNWNAVLPNSNTTIGVKTSVDGGSTFQPIAAAGDAIPNITTMPSPFVDTFATNSSADYTQTNLSGGGAASWTWDTANSQLKATQTTGVDGILEETSVTGADMTVMGDFSKSDSGGLVARLVDTSHCYYCSIADASAASHANTVKLYALGGGGGSTTPLSVYGSTIASTTLTTAGTLATATGGTATNASTKVGTTVNQYVELVGLGTTTITAFSSIQSPTGKGWLLDATTLEGQQIIAGTWTPACKLNTAGNTLTADIYIRAYKRSSAGVYTLIGSWIASASALTSTATVFNPTPASESAMSFATGDKLYVDMWVYITATTQGAAGVINVHQASTSTGVATQEELDTPGYQNPAGGVNLLGTAAIVFTRGSYRRFILSTIGTTIAVSMDGTQLLSVSDSTVTASGGAAVLAGVNNGNQIQCSQFRVQPQGQSVSGISVLTKITLTSTDPMNTPQLLDSATLVTGPDIGLGAVIPATNSYQNTFCSKNFDDLKKQSDYFWYVRSNKSVVFNARVAYPAPFSVASSNAVTVLAGQTIGDFQVANLQVEYSGDLYRNRETLTNVQATQTFTQKFVGDGQSTSWTLDYPVAPGTVPFLTLDGVSEQLLTIGIKGQTSGKQYYYTPGGTAIDQDTSQGVLSPLNTLIVTYQGTYTTNVTVNNTGGFPGTISQSQWAAIAGDSGIVEDILDVSQSDETKNMTLAQATNYANQLLQEFGVIGRTVTFDTYRQGLAPGQQLSVFIPAHQMINAQMLVSQVDTSAVMGGDGGGVVYKYSVTAIEGPSLGDWVKLFSNMFG